MIEFFLEPFWTVQRRFSFQIKSPLTVRTALQGGYKVSLAAGCHAEDKLRLGPSGFAAPAFTGCAFFCTDTPLAHDAQIKLSNLNEPVVPGTWNLIGSSAQQVISATHKL